MRAIKPLSTQDEKAKDTVAVCLFVFKVIYSERGTVLLQ